MAAMTIAQQFEPHRARILQLYIFENNKLEDVMSTMKGDGLDVTSQHIWKNQLKEWGMMKHVSDEGWLAAGKLYKQLEAAGDPEPKVIVRGRIRCLNDFVVRANKQKETPGAFWERSMSFTGEIPGYVEAYRPVHEQSSSQAPVDAPAGSQMSNTSSELNPKSLDGDLRTGGLGEDPMPGSTTPLNGDPELSAFDPEDFMALEEDYDILPDPQSGVLQQELGRVSDQFENLSKFSDLHKISQGGAEELSQSYMGPTMDPGSPQPDSERRAFSQAPLEASEDPLPGTGLGARFSSSAMLACMYNAAGRKSVAAIAVQDATRAMHLMCEARDAWTLLLASVMLNWLVLHDNTDLTLEIMLSVSSAASGVLGASNPICTVLNWMVSAAAAGIKSDGAHKLKEAPTTTEMLRKATEGFNSFLGVQHYSSIVSEYCLCWNLIFVDQMFDEAAERLSRLYNTSLAALGTASPMTLQILAALSRAQLKLKRPLEAMASIEQCIKETPLGRNHPFRLELLMRKAVMLWYYGSLRDAERLYFEITVGRAATLGPRHRRTLAALDSLQKVADKNGTWDAQKEFVDEMLSNPRLAVETYEGLWKTIVEANAGLS